MCGSMFVDKQISGWQPGVLNDAMAITDPATNATKLQVGNDPPGAIAYFGRDNFYSDEEMANCQIRAGVSPPENVYGPLPPDGGLPGCNELSAGPAPAVKEVPGGCRKGATGLIGPPPPPGVELKMGRERENDGGGEGEGESKGREERPRRRGRDRRYEREHGHSHRRYRR